LAFVRVNDPKVGKRVIESLVRRLSEQGVSADCIDYSHRRIRSLFNDLKSRTDIQSPSVFIVSGLERNIVDVDDESRIWPQILNQERDAFREHFPCPFTIWLTDYAMDRLFEGAPDFADWHSAVFRFGPSVYLLPEDDPAPRISSAQRSQRIELLEKRRIELLKADKPNRRRLAQIYRELGFLYGSAETNAQRQAGVGLLRDAAKLFEELKDRNRLAEVLFELGGIYYWLHEFHESHGYFEQAYQIASEVKDETLIVFASQGMGIALRRFDIGLSDRHFKEALQMFRTLHHRRGEADALKQLGDNAGLRSDFDSALRHYHKAQEIYRETHDVSGEANILRSRGVLHAIRGELKRAQRVFEQAKETFKQAADDLGIAHVLQDMGRLHAMREQRNESIAYFEAAIDIYRRNGSPRNEAAALLQLGKTLSELGRADEVNAVLQRVKAIATEIGDKDLLNAATEPLASLSHPDRRDMVIHETLK